MKPTFLFIGPDKTGSSWLDHVLRQHPDCYLPAVKDLRYFDDFYGRGMEWYLSYFQNAPEGTVAAGELSHNYLFSPDAAERIARDLPGVQIVTCLRDPAERSFSHYLFLVRSGLTRKPFEEALDEFPEIIHNSLYARHLEPYFRLFPRERITVAYFDRLKKSPRGFAEDILPALGLRVIDGLGYEEQVLPASRPRNFYLSAAVRLGAETARRVGLTRLVGVLKRSPAVRNLFYVPFTAENRPRLAPDSRARLIERFRPDVERLEEMLERDFPGWLAVEPAGRARVAGPVS